MTPHWFSAREWGHHLGVTPYCLLLSNHYLIQFCFINCSVLLPQNPLSSARRHCQYNLSILPLFVSGSEMTVCLSDTSQQDLYIVTFRQCKVGGCSSSSYCWHWNILQQTFLSLIDLMWECEFSADCGALIKSERITSHLPQTEWRNASSGKDVT